MHIIFIFDIFNYYMLKYFCSMLEELLTEIGLSDKESKMYLTNLRYGTQPTSILAKRAGYNRGTGYVILHSLLTKGLVTKETKKGVQYFSPVHPSQLVHYLEHRKQTIESHKEKIQSALGSFEAIANPYTTKPKFEFYEGIEGARAALDATLDAEENELRSFLSIGDIIEFLGMEYFDDYTSKRVAAGKKLLAIRAQEKDKMAFKNYPESKRYVSNQNENREVRYTDEELAFPMTMYIFDAKIIIISSKEESFGLIIESKELAEMQKRLFHLVWSTSKPQDK